MITPNGGQVQILQSLKKHLEERFHLYISMFISIYLGGLDLGGESTEYQGIDLLSPLNNTSSQNQRHVQLR